jgi:16S rRNA (cytosine1402-N4)-methyltransferase
MEHVPVLLAEVIEWLAPQPGQTIVDGTLGAGGHAQALTTAVGPQGSVIALDRDPAALAAAERNLAGLPVKLAHSNFSELPEVLREIGVEHVDGILLDLGLSSDQLADESRGFSFQSAGPLDLRFDPTRGEPAARLVNRSSERHLADLIYEYGEERYSRRIARAIAEHKRKREIVSAADLADIVRRAIPRSKHEHRIDPATRTFQALRIAVNEELRSLDVALQRLPDCLRPGGRMAIISFHSLEDRRVKEAFRDDARLKNLTRKPIRSSESEIAANPRSRSAKLRVAQRVSVSGAKADSQ